MPSTRGTAPVWVDDRERASGLAAQLRRRHSLQVDELRLTVADIRVGEALLIERKTIADLVASLLDGRFASQMQRLRAAAAPPLQTAVLLEGDVTAAVLAGLDPNELRRALLKLQFTWGHRLIRSRNTEDSAAWIALLAEENAGLPAGGLAFDSSKGAQPGAPHRARTRQPLRGPEAMQLAALRRIPGLGAARAKALLAQFGSISAIAHAGAPAIAALPGFSPASAQAILAHLRHGANNPA